MTNSEKLKQLYLLKNPGAAMQLAQSQILSNLLAQTESTKGEKGEKGEAGPKGEKGDTIVGPRGPMGESIKGEKGDKGNDGQDAIVDIAKIVTLVAKKVKIPIPEKVQIPTVEDIVNEVVKELGKTKKKISIRDIHDLNELIEYLKAGGFRGGGSSSSSGGSFTLLNTLSTVNGINQSFVFSTATAQPSLVVVDGYQLTAIDNNGAVQWTWNSGTKTVTLTTPPPLNSIFAYA